MAVKGVNPFSREKRGTKIIVSAKEDRTVDGIVFSSKWESRCYRELKSVFGENLVLQPRFELQPKFVGPDGTKHRAIEYRADFMINCKERKSPADPVSEGAWILDCKGFLEPIFRMKNKMFIRRYNCVLHLPRKVGEIKALVQRIKEAVPHLVAAQ